MTLRFRTAIGCLAAFAALAAGCSAAVDTQEPRQPRNLEEFDAMFQEINNWGRWGADDELGAMNLITPQKTRDAAALVRSGITVSLAHNPMPGEYADNPDAAFNHTMGRSLRSDTYEFTYHGYGVSHIDSLCHFLWNDRLFNDVSPSESTPEGCGKLGIQNLKSGIVTRGILLDFARLKGVDYLEPQTPLYVEDIEAWEEQAGVRVSAGDIIFVRTGRWARRAALGPWQVSGNSAGLHASVSAMDQGTRRRGRRERRGDRRDAVAGGRGRAAGAHDVDRRARRAHLRQHGPRGAGRDGRRREPLGVHDHRRSDSGRRRHGVAPQPDCRVLTRTSARVALVCECRDQGGPRRSNSGSATVISI